MGMGSPLDCLRRVMVTLEKTWQAWFEEADKSRRKKLETNFEYLLAEAHTFLGYVNEEWRGAFKKPVRTLKYDDELQREVVDDFVPSLQRERKGNRVQSRRR